MIFAHVEEGTLEGDLLMAFFERKVATLHDMGTLNMPFELHRRGYSAS